MVNLSLSRLVTNARVGPGRAGRGRGVYVVNSGEGKQANGEEDETFSPQEWLKVKHERKEKCWRASTREVQRGNRVQVLP